MLSKKSTMTSQKKTLQPSARVVLVIAQLNLTCCLHHCSHLWCPFPSLVSRQRAMTRQFRATGSNKRVVLCYRGDIHAVVLWGCRSCRRLGSHLCQADRAVQVALLCSSLTHYCRCIVTTMPGWQHAGQKVQPYYNYSFIPGLAQPSVTGGLLRTESL